MLAAPQILKALPVADHVYPVPVHHDLGAQGTAVIGRGHRHAIGARAAHRIFSMSGRKPAPMRLGMNPRGGAPPILAKASDLTALYAFAVQPDTLSLWENAPLIVQI